MNIREIAIELHGSGLAGAYPGGYMAAMWHPEGREAGPVFGLTYHGSPTVMCYGLDYFRPSKIWAELVANERHRFYFDAGSNGRPIWCTVDELERVFQELGLLDEQQPPNTTGDNHG